MTKMTLFEVFKSKREAEELGIEIDCPIANPLDLKFTSLIDIKTPDYYEMSFKLKAIEEYTRNIDGEVLTFTDYNLEGRIDLLNPSIYVPIKLRCVDEDALVMFNYESMAYSEDLNEVLNDTERTGKFEIPEDDGKVISYTRVNNIKNHWDVAVKKLIDADHNGKITKSDPITEFELKYWDFQNGSDSFFIEMDKRTGWIKMWKGNFVNLQSIIII